ncbi:MAG: hypothetical protein VB100_13560 [Angelakisella sp.]|nr:hypothetical protein [Angelakisella sp.]
MKKDVAYYRLTAVIRYIFFGCRASGEKKAIKTTPILVRSNMNFQNKTRILVSVAMLSAVAYLLAFIEIQVPLSPSFAKIGYFRLTGANCSVCLWPII